jgi:hypothetical protein
MAFLRLIEESEGTPPLRRLYQAAKARAGYIANITKVMSHDAATAELSIQFYVGLMHAPNALSRARKEMLATVVSCINDCYY